MERGWRHGRKLHRVVKLVGDHDAAEHGQKKESPFYGYGLVAAKMKDNGGNVYGADADQDGEELCPGVASLVVRQGHISAGFHSRRLCDPPGRGPTICSQSLHFPYDL